MYNLLMSKSSHIGKVIDSYRIVESLGEGGMGIVYKAVHTKLDKVVALKMIAPGLAANSKFIRRFQTEARALAKLKDPNIVGIHDLRSHDNQWFIAMEYVEGIDLFDIVRKEGAFSWKKSIVIVKQILSAIGHAHKVGIIHRDIKPHNIMLTKDDTVKITDFGLAKDESSQMKTMTVATGGTLNYMSPEHVKGFSYIEKRSDLYCVGIILYEMVTGEVPFKNLDSDFDIRESILRKNFDTPTTINKKIPSDLDDIIMKSIEKNPDDRFQTAEEMLDALENFEKGNKVSFKRKRRKNNKKSILLKFPIPVVLIIFLTIVGYYFDFFNSNSTEKTTNLFSRSALSISSNPKNALIYLSNESIGKTPINDYILQSGIYTLKLVKDNFVTLDTTIKVESGKNIDLVFNLLVVESIAENKIENKPQKTEKSKSSDNANFASLMVNSNPPGADVFINNEIRGTTPLNLDDLLPGDYEIKISKTGHHEYIGNIELESEDEKDISTELFPLTGGLTINTSPKDVMLNLDGEIHQIQNGLIRLPAPIGKKKIQIYKNGYSDFSDEVLIESNRQSTINATLSQLLGKLIVIIRPWGKIFINNELQENITDTKFENELPVDTYNLKVEHPTLGYWQKNVRLNEDQVTEIKINFTKNIPITISAFGENGEPFAGNILIDGKFTGKTTPQEIGMPVGFHKIQIEKQGYTAIKGQRELLIEENYKDPIIFILKRNEKIN